MFVLITGASEGLGKALAYRFYNDGYDLILVSRSKTKMENIKADLISKGREIILYENDLSVPENYQSIIDYFQDKDIKYLVNNAGVGRLGLIHEIPKDVEINMIHLNILALHFITKRYIELYDRGTVVNISSLAAFLPTPLHASYAATKSYVYSFSRAVHEEMKHSNKDIEVLTVAPGPVKTEFFKRAKASFNRGMDAEKCARLIYKGIKKRKKLIIPGLSMKLVYYINKLLPHSLSMKIAYKIQNRK